MLHRTLIAHNDAADSGNPMHDEDAAKALGFKGAVVPGVTVYGYICHLLIAHFGDAWLGTGYSQVRFRQPVIAGEELELRGEISAGQHGEVLSVEVRNSHGTLTTTGRGAMAADTFAAFENNGVLSEKPFPAQRRAHGPKWPPTEQSFKNERLMRSFTTELSHEEQKQFCSEMRDEHVIYQRFLHPAWLLRQANIIVDRNVAVGAWIHTESEVANLGLAKCGEPLEVRAEVIDLFERKNNHFVDLDVLITNSGESEKPILRAMHRAIYQPAIAS